MNVLGAAVWREIQEAESKAMERLLEAWDREIERDAKALERAAELHTQKALAEAALERQETSRQTLEAIAQSNVGQKQGSDAAMAAAVESHLRGLVAQAASGDDVSIAIPTGVRIAGALGGTSVAEIASLVAEARTIDEPVRDAAQHSALGALGAGFMPHPEDLASILSRSGRDPSWQEGLSIVAERLDKSAPVDLSAPPALRVRAAVEQVGALDAHRKLLSSYGGGRLLTLVARPGDLKSDLPRTCPPMEAGPKMGHAALGKVLDGLFRR